MENVKSSCKKTLLKKMMIKNIKQQSKLTFNGIPKPYTNYDNYMDKTDLLRVCYFGIE